MGRGNDVEEIIIAGRMAFHFVMVLVGLPGSVNSQPNAREIIIAVHPTHRVEASLAEYFFFFYLRFLLLQLQSIN